MARGEGVLTGDSSVEVGVAVASVTVAVIEVGVAAAAGEEVVARALFMFQHPCGCDIFVLLF